MLGQSIDSLRPNFKIKKIHVGLELGRSPRLDFGNYVTGGLMIKKYPFYKFDLGYNFKIGQKTYFSTCVGVAHEEQYYSQSNTTTTEFTYTTTINSNTTTLIGTKNNYTANFFHSKSVFTTFSFGFFQVYSPFKNENLKTTWQLGLIVKPLTWRNTKWDFYHNKDSTVNSQQERTLSEHTDYSSKSNVKIDGPVDFLLGFSPGLLYDQSFLQHRFGINFCAQLTSPDITLLQPSGNYIRFFYFVYF